MLSFVITHPLNSRTANALDSYGPTAVCLASHPVPPVRKGYFSGLGMPLCPFPQAWETLPCAPSPWHASSWWGHVLISVLADVSLLENCPWPSRAESILSHRAAQKCFPSESQSTHPGLLLKWIFIPSIWIWVPKDPAWLSFFQAFSSMAFYSGSSQKYLWEQNDFYSSYHNDSPFPSGECRQGHLWKFLPFSVPSSVWLRYQRSLPEKHFPSELLRSE
jgi:hypothetical protein